MFATRYCVHRIDIWLVDIAIGKSTLCSPTQALTLYDWLVKGIVASTLALKNWRNFFIHKMWKVNYCCCVILRHLPTILLNLTFLQNKIRRFPMQNVIGFMRIIPPEKNVFPPLPSPNVFDAGRHHWLLIFFSRPIVSNSLWGRGDHLPYMYEQFEIPIK